MQRSSGRQSHDYVPSNFLASEQRRTFTETPAMRAEARRQILAAHPDRATEIRQRAALPQAIAREQMISGTSTTNRLRFNADEFVRQVRRDPQSGRIVISWERVSEHGEGG